MKTLSKIPYVTLDYFFEYGLNTAQGYILFHSCDLYLKPIFIFGLHDLQIMVQKETRGFFNLLLNLLKKVTGLIDYRLNLL